MSFDVLAFIFDHLDHRLRGKREYSCGGRASDFLGPTNRYKYLTLNMNKVSTCRGQHVDMDFGSERLDGCIHPMTNGTATVFPKRTR